MSIEICKESIDVICTRSITVPLSCIIKKKGFINKLVSCLGAESANGIRMMKDTHYEQTFQVFQEVLAEVIVQI